jgi:hypothetical protein
MVAQITLNTESPHPTGCFQTEALRRLIRQRRTLEVRLAGLIILADYDCGSAYHLRELSRARTQRLVREASASGLVTTTPERPVTFTSSPKSVQ